jgi:hypothetical protein
MYKSVEDIDTLKQWIAKILQGVASEGTGNTAGKFIKRAIHTPIPK